MCGQGMMEKSVRARKTTVSCNKASTSKEGEEGGGRGRARKEGEEGGRGRRAGKEGEDRERGEPDRVLEHGGHDSAGALAHRSPCSPTVGVRPLLNRYLATRVRPTTA